MDKKVYIIAEAGVNHNGSLDLAKKLIEEGAKAGVDAVKFQTFKASNLLANTKVEKAPYQTREISENQYSMLKRLELDYNDFKELKKTCDLNKVDFLSTPYDGESVKLLSDLGVDTFKVASADLVNQKLIEDICKVGKRIIFSTGMATLGEIERTVAYVQKINSNIKIELLHCTTAYPTPYEDINMNFMKTLVRAFEGIDIGYSDHTEGIEIPVMAVSMGSRIIEKHFTLDRTMDGPDHFASVEPGELKKMVKFIRNVENSFGTFRKIISSDERENKRHMRRSIHVNRDIYAGEKIIFEDIKFSRPGNGLEVWGYKELINKKMLRNLKKGDPLTKGDIEWK